MIAIKELLVKFGQALEVMAWGQIHRNCEALLCNVKFYYIGFALDVLWRF